MFSDKEGNRKIILVENGEVLLDDKQISECFNEYFINITDTLNIVAHDIVIDVNTSEDPVLKAISKYTQHPSILLIREHVASRHAFEFTPVDSLAVLNEINALNTGKKSSGPVPASMLKCASGVCYEEITRHVNKSFELNTFSSNLKKSDVTPAFKADDSTCKKNFRPISVLSTLSKIYERLMYSQMLPFIKPKLSNLLCGFREGYSTQHALLRLVERCKKCLDDKGVIGMVLTDLSKAYDCLPYDLLVAKLHAYGFGLSSLQMIYSYLTSRKQRVKIKSTYSSWLDVKSGVPQGSVLGPLLFNVFINDIFYAIEASEICNFADDNTIYALSHDVESMIAKLEIDLYNILKWFDSNFMLANPTKFQVMFLGLKKNQNLVLEINGEAIAASKEVKLLGVTIDSKLNFKSHVKALCMKTNRKVSAFARVARYLDLQKAKLLYQSFVASTFKYCPLIWLFCGKTANENIDRVHKRALRVLLDDHESTFEVLLAKNNETTIHIQNLHVLMIEIYKTLNCTNPSFVQECFVRKDTKYDLRTKDLLQIPAAKSIMFGIDSITFRGSLLWNSMPDLIKSASSAAIFKRNIKNWSGDKCKCKICR